MSVSAKLFTHDHGQAVQLPGEFRFEGNEVRITRHGDALILEPIRHQPVDLAEVWARIDRLRGEGDYFEEGSPEDPPPAADERRFFE